MNKVSTLTQPVFSDDTQVPLVIRTVTPRAANNMQVAGGMPEQGEVVTEYVLLNALPPELKERVITAIKAQMQA